MDIETIGQQLEVNTGSFPIDAVRAAIEQREAMTPVLLAALQEAVDTPEEIERKPSYLLHIYAMYLLAQFRERAAYPLLVKFFSTPGEISLDLTGDVVTEGLHRILASVCHGDVEPIYRMIEDPALNEYVRSACLRTLTLLVSEGILSRDKVVGYFRDLFHGKLERDPDSEVVWSNLALACCELYPEELMQEIEQAYDDGLVDPFFMNMESTRNELAKGKEKALQELKRNAKGLIDDTVSEMKWWACFNKEKNRAPAPRIENPMMTNKPVVKGKKIGRNDPCPCGSGKKYKKCCLH